MALFCSVMAIVSARAGLATCLPIIIAACSASKPAAIEADMPMLVSGSSVYLFSPDGLIDASTASTAPTLSGPDATSTEPTTPNPLTQKPEQEVEVKPEVEDTEVEAEDVPAKETAEVKAFMKWANKGKRARLFEFKHLDPIVGDALNRCAFDGDLDTARALAKAYLT